MAISVNASLVLLTSEFLDSIAQSSQSNLGFGWSCSCYKTEDDEWALRWLTQKWTADLRALLSLSQKICSVIIVRCLYIHKHNSFLSANWSCSRFYIFVFSSSSCSFTISHCLKITQNVAFEFLNFGIFHQFLSY